MTQKSSCTVYTITKQMRVRKKEVESKKQTDITVPLMASMTSLTLPWAHPGVSEVAR